MTSPDLISMLEKMLSFNPHHRPSVKLLLRDPMFDQIRNLDNEKESSDKIFIS